MMLLRARSKERQFVCSRSISGGEKPSHSVQVLQEYFVVATRKLGVDAALAQQKVEVLARERVVRLDAQDVVAAIELHRLRVISFWDALIVHAARLANCAVIYSEDMIGGGQIGNVRVVNPFA